MKIQTRKLTNQSINFSNEEVVFDKSGNAEVSDELGKDIIKNFPELVWEEGKESIKKAQINEDDTAQVATLKNEVSRLERVNEGLKMQLAKSKEDEKNWRDECAKYQKMLADIDNKIDEVNAPESETDTPSEETIENTPKEEEKGIVIPEGYEEVYKEMLEKNLNALKKMCKDDLSMSDETLADFKGQGAKDKLIKYIFGNVVKKS